MTVSTPGFGMSPALSVKSGDQKRVESVARLLAIGCRYDPDEQMIDATREPMRLSNGSKVLQPSAAGPFPLWHMFIADAHRVIAGFGVKAIDMALAIQTSVQI